MRKKSIIMVLICLMFLLSSCQALNRVFITGKWHATNPNMADSSQVTMEFCNDGVVIISDAREEITGYYRILNDYSMNMYFKGSRENFTYILDGNRLILSFKGESLYFERASGLTVFALKMVAFLLIIAITSFILYFYFRKERLKRSA